MRELLTTLLDLVGMVAVVVALSLFVARFGAPYAVGVFGVGLLGVSQLIEWRTPRIPAEELD